MPAWNLCNIRSEINYKTVTNKQAKPESTLLYKDTNTLTANYEHRQEIF